MRKAEFNQQIFGIFLQEIIFFKTEYKKKHANLKGFHITDLFNIMIIVPTGYRISSVNLA